MIPHSRPTIINPHLEGDPIQHIPLLAPKSIHEYNAAEFTTYVDSFSYFKKIKEKKLSGKWIQRITKKKPIGIYLLKNPNNGNERPLPTLEGKLIVGSKATFHQLITRLECTPEMLTELCKKKKIDCNF